MRKVRCRNGFKENCCHGKSLVTDAAQAVEKKEQPMSETKNALVELAERLSNDAEYLYGNNNKASEDVSKAQRIVAVLAKVDSTYVADPVHNNICNMAYDALVKIRKIAEGGVKDGK